MYTYTGFLNKEETDLLDMSLPVKVNSCGIYRLLSRPVMETYRPEGREDYQLLFIVSGRVRVTFFDGSLAESRAGNMILYRPGQYQQYHYFLEDNPEVYWLHFTGYQVEEMLSEIGFHETDVLFTGVAAEYKEIFLYIIRELQISSNGFEEMTALYLRQLFLLIKRNQMEGSGSSQNQIKKEMQEAVHYFNENYAQNIEIETYAQKQHMSVCWFIRSFKKYMGITPLQYLTSIRINRATKLLSDTEYTVSEISSIVGYDNPLYFSRIFKKNMGISPKNFRGR
ncbi:helix-turn-helix domain-containing protein [Lachnospiraceae bacterium OttesenSCG-928-D06]|nr:helix-turn-helix domain-containing protein [Lachnospiraceae bacterium OttesenSCG-928-D06]